MTQPQFILVGITQRDSNSRLETTWYRAHSITMRPDSSTVFIYDCGASRTCVRVSRRNFAGVVPGDVETGENPGILEYLKAGVTQ